MTQDAQTDRTAFPVAVRLRSEPRYHGRWRYIHWSLADVVTDETLADTPAEGRRIRTDGDVTDYLWTGLAVTLVRSNAETYWYNLTSQSPSLFVVCREDPDNGLMPVVVTLDHDDATRQFEGDGEIFATAVPAAMLPHVEAFIMAHYQPQPARRRRKPDGD